MADRGHIGAGTESWGGEMLAVAGMDAIMGVTEPVVTSEMKFKSCRMTRWFGLDEPYMDLVRSLGHVIRIGMLLWWLVQGLGAGCKHDAAAICGH